MNFDPLDPGYQVDPYPHFKVLREQPAVWVGTLGAWFVGRYKDVRAMSSDTETFSQKRFARISKGEFDYAPAADQLISTDPPEHTRLRKLSSYAFRPRQVREMEEAIVGITDSYVGPLAARGGEFDFHDDLAKRIPIHSITRMLGVPAEKGPVFQKWTMDILSAANRARMTSAELAEVRSSVDAARAYFTGVIAQRRVVHGSDMISAWVQAQEEGDTLIDEEILGLSILLLTGGDSTTAHLISNAMTAFWRFPGQYEEVRDDRSLLPKAIEETLRYESPVQTVFWTTTRDVDLDGVHIPAEANVIGVWSSANRDPERFENPDEFDIHREQAHVAFGFGPHFCLGAVLARVQARIVLNAVLDKLPHLKPAEGTHVEWNPSYWIRGPRRLPVTA